jgi:formamidopyrimidine-DNA glycosylase
VVFETGEGTRIVYTDHRRFGLMLLAPTAVVESKLQAAGELGPEPLDDAFTPAVLSAALRGKKIISIPLAEATAKNRTVDQEMMDAAFGILEDAEKEAVAG